MNETTRQTEFVALGHAGSSALRGDRDVPEPGRLTGEHDERRARRGLPDHRAGRPHTAAIDYWPDGLCIESKSLKLYLATYRNEGVFCEALAVKIRDDVAEALELPADKVRVVLTQKARGGITITATS